MRIRTFRILSLFTDLLILTMSFLLMIWLKPASLRNYLPSHAPFFAVLVILWIIVSLASGKMHKGKITNLKTLFSRVILSNVFSLALASLLMYSFRQESYSRAIVLGTVVVATAGELILGMMFLAMKKATIMPDETTPEKPTEEELVAEAPSGRAGNIDDTEINPRILSLIKKEAGEDMALSVIKLAGEMLNKKTAVISTRTTFNVENLPFDDYDYIINLHRINDIPNPDVFLDAVNSRLKINGYFLCCVETKDQRKKRILSKLPPVINYLFYTVDFMYKRVMPKLRITRGLYFMISKGNNTVYSRAETLGRLSRAGFIIRQEELSGKMLCIEVRKTDKPLPLPNNGYGPLIALNRVGKNGEIFKVYKLRTMHPYSEYIQDYVFDLYKLQEGGKIKNDFRITSWGGFCRKVWLDELPMIINLLKGEMKIVGVRPLSQHYFNLYSQELREKRIRVKPGLLPPFYADMPSTLEEIQISEERYLNAYFKRPLTTDVKYFFKGIGNILFRNARSQ